MRPTVMLLKHMFEVLHPFFGGSKERRGDKKQLTTGGAQGSSSGVAMHNPLIKWAKRNAHSDPPIPWGLKGSRDLSPFLTPTHKERRGKKKYLFSDTRKMPVIVCLLRSTLQHALLMKSFEIQSIYMCFNCFALPP